MLIIRGKVISLWKAMIILFRASCPYHLKVNRAQSATYLLPVDSFYTLPSPSADDPVFLQRGTQSCSEIFIFSSYLKYKEKLSTLFCVSWVTDMIF